jgi:hypothetical protein
VGAGDDFFALGGHSLQAAQFAARLAVMTGTRVPIRVVFEMPTVAELSQWVERNRPQQPREEITL